MNNLGGALSFESYLGTEQFEKGSRKIETEIMGITSTAKSETTKIEQAFQRMGRLAAGGLAGFGLAQLPGEIISVRGEFQQLEIALNTMLGSKSKADKLTQEIIQTAAATPFGLKDLSASTKQLLAYGSASNEVIGEIKMLGDVASGVSTPINDLVYLYGTLRSQGRAYAVDIRQFAGRGIPIYAELAKVLGVQKEEVNALVEAGKVGFPQVEQAFKNMTSAGGMFSGLMEAQSKSLPGLIERLKDAVDQMFNDIGRSNQDLAEGVIHGTSVIVENYQTVIDVLAVLAAAYGTYKTAVIASQIINTAATSGAYTAEAAQLSKLLSVEALARVSKTGLVAGTIAHADAIKTEVLAMVEANAAQIASMRIGVSAANEKRIETLASAKAASAKLVEARANLANAVAHQTATAQYLNTKVREGAARAVETAQNGVIAAQEKASITRKAALTASSEFHASKLALETAANTTATVAKNVSAAAEIRLTAAQSLRAAVTRQMIALQTAFNASLLSNPIVLATVAVVALGVAMWALHDGTTAAEKAQEALKKQDEDAAQKKQELTSKTSELISVLRDETQTRFAQAKAFSDLQKIYPQILGQMQLHQFQALSTADSQKLLNKAIDDMGKSNIQSNFDMAVKKVSDLEDKIKSLVETQKSSGPGSGGLIVPIADARKELEAARIEVENIGKQIKENERLEWLANAPAEEKKKHYQDIVNELQKERSEIEKSLGGLTGMIPKADGLKRIFAEMRLIQLNKDLVEAKGHIDDIGKTNAPASQNKAYWEKQKNTAQDSLDMLPVSQRGSAEWNRLAAEISNADTKLKAYNTTSKVSEKDKPQPFGSVAYWNQIANKAKEVLDKTNPKNSAAILKQTKVLENAELMADKAKLSITPFGTLEYWSQVEKIAGKILSDPDISSSEANKQKSVIINAQEKSDALRKQLAVKSFDDELQYKKSQYELYERWVQNMGEETAKSQFSSLMQNGASFADYLNSEIKKLETQKATPGIGLIGPEEQQLEKFKNQLAEISGVDTPMQKFQKSLDAARDSSGSLTEELIKLKEIQAGLNPDDNSANGIAQRQALIEREIEVQKQRKQMLGEFLVSVTGSEEKRLEITKHYADLRAALEAKAMDKQSAGYKKAVEAINKKEKEELDVFEIDTIKGSEAYKELEKIIKLSTNEQTKIRVDAARGQLAMIKNLHGEESDDYIQALLKLRQAEDEHRQHSIQNWQAISGVVGDLGDALESMGGTIGEIGGALSGLAKNTQSVTSILTMKEGEKLSVNQYAAAVQGVIQMVTTLISASKQRAEAEKAFAAARLGFENDYELALNKKKGEDYNHNPFYTDYDGKIKAGVAKYADASKKYQDAIDKLDEGKAKERQKNAVDGKTVGQMAGAGAVAGAVVGSILPGVGTAIGAVVGGAIGAIGGLFAKKKKDVFGSLMEQYPELVKETADGWFELDVAMAQALITNNQVDDKTKEMLENAIALNESLQEAKQQIEDTVVELSGQIGDRLKSSLVEAFRAGNDAAQALKQTVGEIIVDMVTNLVFSRVIGPVLDNFMDEAKASLEGGDGSILDDLVRLGDALGPAATVATQIMDATDKYLQDAGYKDAFGRSQGKDQALEGVVKGVTEETVSVLVGQMGAIRIYNAQIAFDTRSALLVLGQISDNTFYTRLLVDTNLKLDKLISQGNISSRGFGNN